MKALPFLAVLLSEFLCNVEESVRPAHDPNSNVSEPEAQGDPVACVLRGFENQGGAQAGHADGRIRPGGVAGRGGDQGARALPLDAGITRVCRHSREMCGRINDLHCGLVASSGCLWSVGRKALLPVKLLRGPFTVDPLPHFRL